MASYYHDENFSKLLSDDGDLFLKYFFNKYYLDLCKISFKYVGRTDIAEDLVQDVFINIWNKRENLSHVDKVKPYLITSVVNTSINYIKSKFGRQNFLDEDSINDSPSAFNQHDQVISQELSVLVKTAIEELPDKCRTIFTLSRFSGLSYKEIAEQLNISIKTVEAQISIAIKRIQQFLAKYGYIILFFLFDN